MQDIPTNYVLRYALRWLSGKKPGNPALWMHLFTNDYIFTADTTLDQLRECTADGYEPQQLPAALWLGGAANGIGLYTGPQIQWVLKTPADTPITVYGHWISDGQAGPVLWGRTWPTALAIQPSDTEILTTPSIRDLQCLGP